MASAPSINLSSLNGTNGYRLDGAAANAGSGACVSSAGDVNGDGLADIIIGCFGPNSYVVFGQAGGFASSINLAGLDGSNGFRVAAGGPSVASAGDVNGDGLDDVIIGDTSDAGLTGASYVVFGKASGFASAIAPSSLDGNNGFKLVGVAPFDLAGCSVASAGDVNGDGFADLIIGASGAYSQTGASYVVFGKPGGFASSINLSSLDGTNGFQLVGVAEFDSAGGSVASAGDVNGDGFADLIIGASGTFEQASPSPSYLVFGKASGFDPSIDLLSLDGSSGFRLDGVAADDYSGFSVASAGDVNGDGFADLTSGVSANIAENATGTVYTATGTDPDADPLSWSLGGTDAALFNINAATGDVSFKTSPDFEAPADAGQNNIYDITVTAFDGSLSSLPRAVAITVTDVKEATLGTQGPDTLSGTAQNDTLQGLGGDDGLFGLAGDDVLDGGAGNDISLE